MSEERNEFEYQNNQNENGNYSSQQNGYTYNPFAPGGKPKTRAWSIASLVTGIIAVICCCLGWTGLIFGAIAVVSSVISRKNLGYFDGLSIAGLILGIFGLVFGVVVLIVTLTMEEFWVEFEKAFWEEYNKMYPEG